MDPLPPLSLEYFAHILPLAIKFGDEHFGDGAIVEDVVGDSNRWRERVLRPLLCLERACQHSTHAITCMGTRNPNTRHRGATV